MPTARARLARGCAGAALALVACTAQNPVVTPPTTEASGSAGPATPTGGASSSRPSSGAPAVELPAGELRPLVPAPAEAPADLVPVLPGSGPRDLAAVAAFSADPSAAAAALTAHRFRIGYAAQYASPRDGRSLSVVVTRFADAAGAAADLDGDLAAPGGQVLDAAPLGGQVGQVSQLRRQPLPGSAATELLTLRFRVDATTWLVAWAAAAPADPRVPVELGRRLASR